MLNTKALEILEKRGLDGETLARYGVSSFQKDGSESEWVKFPFLQDGQTVNHKYRTIEGEKKFYQDADAIKCFWNFDALKDEAMSDLPLVSTEGEFDALAAILCGFVRTVSVPDGAPAQRVEGEETEKYSYLDDALPLLHGCKNIIIASDSDPQGGNLLHDLSLRLGRQRCKWVKYPEGCKDLNDVLLKHGPDAVKKALSGAIWCKVDGVYRMSELPPPPQNDVVSTGFPGMDKHFRVRLGDFTVVTGIPSHGKSTWVNDLCCRLNEQYGWPIAFASFEQHPAVDHKRNLMRWKTGEHPVYLTEDNRREAEKWIDRNFSFIVPDEDDDVTLDWVLEKASTSVIRHNARVVVIDPWNEMDHTFPADMSLTQYTGYAIKQFRKFARKHNVHMIIVAHPAKMKKNADGKIDIPNGYDISDSSHWFNKADVGITVHRQDEGSIIRVWKARYNGIIGANGDIRAIFNPVLNRFEITEGAPM